MTDKERAKKLLSSTRFVRSEAAIDLILVHDDEIRRECADMAKTSASIMLSKLLTALEHEAIPTALDALEAEITGKETGG